MKRVISIILIMVLILSVGCGRISAMRNKEDKELAFLDNEEILDSAKVILDNTVDIVKLKIENVELAIGMIKELVPKMLSAFSDVKESDWFKDNLALLYGLGVTEGDGLGNFLPNKELTASEYLKMLVVALDNQQYKAKNNAEWDKPYIDRALALGLVKEGEIKDYRKPLNRYNMARIIIRACDEEYGDYEQYKSSIKDYNNIPSEFKDYVLKAYSKGIINGYADASFGGQETMRRSEATAVIARLIDPNQRKEPKAIDHETEEILKKLQSISMKDKRMDMEKGMGEAIANTIYKKYKHLGDKIVSTGKYGGIYYDGDGVPKNYEWNTPLMLKYGCDGSTYNVSFDRDRNPDKTSFEILEDIIKIFLKDEKDQKRAYNLYLEYLDREPKNFDTIAEFTTDYQVEFQMFNAESGVIGMFSYEGGGS